MDNELHYLTFDPEKIWEEMIINYVEAGGDLLYPGDEKEMLLRSVQADIVQALAGVDNALRMQTLRYAVGAYLDVIGENRGCSRLEATYATAEAKFIMTQTEDRYVLPAGTLMASANGVYYALADNLEVGLATMRYMKIVAVNPGASGNLLKKDGILLLQKEARNITSIVANADATGGMDRENDDEYRERIREYGLASVTTGPASQYKAATMEVNSRIIDAKAVNGGAGVVNVYISTSYEDDMTHLEEAEEIAAEVQKALNDQTVRPLTDTVTANVATVKRHTVYAVYEADSYSVAKNDLLEVCRQYTDWQNYYIGREFNPDKLKSMLYNAGVNKVTLWESSTGSFPTETPVYTEIADSERNYVIVELMTKEEFDNLVL